jgi:hypothetical protein
MLSAASLGLYLVQTGTANKAFIGSNFWQIGLIGMAWLCSALVAWQFCRSLFIGEIDFDGIHWYLGEKVGTLSVRFDGQYCMLARFEDDLNNIDWLWLEARCADKNEPSHWHDLRRAVYSRATEQILSNLI